MFRFSVPWLTLGAAFVACVTEYLGGSVEFDTVLPCHLSGDPWGSVPEKIVCFKVLVGVCRGCRVR